MTPFRPHPWTAGAHRQTLLAYWYRRRLRWTPPTDDLAVQGEGDARLLVRASWQEGPREAHPALVLVHGLGGTDEAAYVLAAGLHAWSLGWHVLRMNMRGAGAGEALCPRLYNAGLDQDLLAVLAAGALRVSRLAVVGFSLGGNLTMLALGRGASKVPAAVFGAAAVSPPLDLEACAHALRRRQNRIYDWHFVLSLRDGYARRQRRRPDLYEAGRERGIRSLWDFDERITAPYGGYPSLRDYYGRSSAGPHLPSVRVPSLLLAAEDDPMIPAESVQRWPVSSFVEREMTPTGGHVGFVAPTRAPGRFWAAERVLAFLDGLR